MNQTDGRPDHNSCDEPLTQVAKALQTLVLKRPEAQKPEHLVHLFAGATDAWD